MTAVAFVAAVILACVAGGLWLAYLAERDQNRRRVSLIRHQAELIATDRTEVTRPVAAAALAPDSPELDRLNDWAATPTGLDDWARELADQLSRATPDDFRRTSPEDPR